MLTYENVAKMFNNLAMAGIRPPENSYSIRRGPVWEFWSRFMFLQPEELEQVEKKLLELHRWPSYAQVVEIVEQVMGENMQGLVFKEELSKQEDESVAEHTEKLGKLLFPHKSLAWWLENALALRQLYRANHSCTACKGKQDNCPYGNRLVGQIAKHNGRLQLKRLAGLCKELERAKNAPPTPEPVHTEQYLKGQSYASGTDDFEHGDIRPEVYEQLELYGRETRGMC